MVDVLVHDLNDIQAYATITRKRKKALDKALQARDRRCVVPGCQTAGSARSRPPPRVREARPDVERERPDALPQAPRREDPPRRRGSSAPTPNGTGTRHRRSPANPNRPQGRSRGERRSVSTSTPSTSPTSPTTSRSSPTASSRSSESQPRLRRSKPPDPARRSVQGRRRRRAVDGRRPPSEPAPVLCVVPPAATRPEGPSSPTCGGGASSSGRANRQRRPSLRSSGR